MAAVKRSDINSVRQALERLREALEADLRVLRPTTACGTVPTETNLELVAQIESDLARVDAAFQRLQTGLYGYCVGCGDEIELNRLRADPAATLCLGCSRRVQRRASHC
jgi:DnaK suppressor protein